MYVWPFCCYFPQKIPTFGAIDASESFFLSWSDYDQANQCPSGQKRQNHSQGLVEKEKQEAGGGASKQSPRRRGCCSVTVVRGLTSEVNGQWSVLTVDSLPFNSAELLLLLRR